MSTHAPGITSLTEERACVLLGSGLPPETVAATLGVTVSRISQLLAKEDFALEVTKLRFEVLQKHNTRDLSYDQLEDKLIQKLEDLLPLMVRPLEVIRAIQVVNSAKRRGTSTLDSPTVGVGAGTQITLTIPTKIVNKFTLNIHNQVVQAGEQSLVTIQPKALLDLNQESSVPQLTRGREFENSVVGTQLKENILDRLKKRI